MKLKLFDPIVSAHVTLEHVQHNWLRSYFFFIIISKNSIFAIDLRRVWLIVFRNKN